MHSDTRPGAGDTFGQRMVAAALRGTLRTALRPAFRAGRPVAQQRRWLAAVTRAMPAARGVRFAHGRVGDVPGEWVAAKSRAETERAILYLHGGAYCLGSPATHRVITGHLALRCQARVFAADYRLAPEHPFPAAVDDAVAAYRGLLAGAHDGAAIVLAGDSAGGGLCVATTLALRGLGLPLPGAMALFSPWVDLAGERPRQAPPGEVMLGDDWLAECAGWYLAGRDAHEPLASPLFADLAGLPRTLIQVGSDELLLPDSRRLHARLEAAGVRVTLSVHARRWHVFQMHAGVLRDADRALDEVAGFLSA